MTLPAPFAFSFLHYSILFTLLLRFLCGMSRVLQNIVTKFLREDFVILHSNMESLFSWLQPDSG